MAEEKTFKSVMIDALNLHNRTVRDYMNQVADWKEKFELLQKQKHKYQEEYRNVKKEVENYTQENSKLKGEIDSLRKIVNREHRNEKCAACMSFQHTIQTLKGLYENTIQQKDSHITYLESRIKELERVKKDGSIDKETVASAQNRKLPLSPDSTCKYTPNKSLEHKPNNSTYTNGTVQSNVKTMSQDQGDYLPLDSYSERTEKGPKLRLPRNKKRSRYSEDPSPEQKRQRLENKKSTVELCGDDLEVVKADKKRLGTSNQDEETNLVVPETCISDIDIMEEDIDDTSVGKLEHGEKTAISLGNSQTRSKVVNKNTGNRRKWKIAMDTSSSSDTEVECSTKVNVQEGQSQRKKDINSSWLHSMLKSPGCENGAQKGDKSRSRIKNDAISKEEESPKITKGLMLRKHKSDPQNLVDKSSTLSASNVDTMSYSQLDIPLQVVPLKNPKIPSRKDSPCNNSKNVTSSRSKTRNQKSNSNTPGMQSPCLVGKNSQHAIEVPSDSESPLILRTSGITSEAKQKYPEVDILFEESDESPSGKTGESSRLEKAEEITRKVKNKKPRSQEKSPDLLNLSKEKRNSEEKSAEISASPILKDRKESSKNKIIVAQTGNAQDNENKLRQTTLSQAFMNSTKQDSDLQQAIERSLIETKHKKQGSEDQDLIEIKENSPPFKKPAIPKHRSRKHKQMRSPDLDETIAPDGKSKHLNDLDLDDTVAPSRIDGENSNTCDQEKVNGSLDPAIQLSQLCGDSEYIDEDMIKNKVKNDGLTESVLQTDDENVHTLRDFRLEDLQGNSEIPKTSTCVEFDDESQAIPSSSTSVKFGSGKSRRQRRKLKTGDTQEVEKPENNTKQIMDDSFDMRPKKAEPEYAYVDVVRGRDERRKLKAFWCQECADYYTDTGMTDEDIQKKMQSCSRHRAAYVPPDTPEHFWSIGFMDTPECEERGYINVENPEEEREPRLRRRRGYKQLFKSRKEDEDS